VQDEYGIAPGNALDVHSAVITINEENYFFKGSPKNGFAGAGAGLRGATARFRGFVLLHELGHVTGALNPNDTGGGDAATQAQKQNNEAIKKNCSKTLQALSNK